MRGTWRAGLVALFGVWGCSGGGGEASPPPAPAGPPAAAAQPAPAADPAARIHALATAWNAGDWDGALEHVADDFRLTAVGVKTPVVGRVALRNLWDGTRKQLPDEKMTVRRTFARGSVLAAHVVITATFGPDKVPIGSEALWVFDVRSDGILAAMTGYSNGAAIAVQTGQLRNVPPVAVPGHEAASEAAAGDPDQGIQEVVDRWIRARQGDDIAGSARALLLDGIESFRNTTGTTVRGRDAVLADLAVAEADLRDVNIAVTSLASAGSFVLVRGHLSAEPVGTPKGERTEMFTIGFAELYDVRDGKIARVWEFTNAGAMFEQRGLTPAPAPG